MSAPFEKFYVVRSWLRWSRFSVKTLPTVFGIENEFQLSFVRSDERRKFIEDAINEKLQREGSDKR